MRIMYKNVDIYQNIYQDLYLDLHFQFVFDIIKGGMHEKNKKNKKTPFKSIKKGEAKNAEEN